MKILIQLALILGILLVIVRLLRTRSARGQAVRRLAAVMFGVVAVLSVVFPASWTVVANFFGVGRGTDMVLYSLVVAFLSYTVTSYGRFRDLEAPTDPAGAQDCPQRGPGTASGAWWSRRYRCRRRLAISRRSSRPGAVRRAPVSYIDARG